MSFILKLFLLLSIIFFTSLNAFDELYFLPNDSKIAKKVITKLLKSSTKSIDILMYNFTYKKFNKAIDKAILNGANVTILYYKTKLKYNKNIDLIKTKRKLHIKLAIIDNKYVIFGSANWKKESFGANYEIIHITDDIKVVKKFQKIFEIIKKEN